MSNTLLATALITNASSSNGDVVIVNKKYPSIGKESMLDIETKSNIKFTCVDGIVSMYDANTEITFGQTNQSSKIESGDIVGMYRARGSVANNYFLKVIHSAKNMLDNDLVRFIKHNGFLHYMRVREPLDMEMSESSAMLFHMKTDIIHLIWKYEHTTLVPYRWYCKNIENPISIAELIKLVSDTPLTSTKSLFSIISEFPNKIKLGIDAIALHSKAKDHIVNSWLSVHTDGANKKASYTISLRNGKQTVDISDITSIYLDTVDTTRYPYCIVDINIPING